METILTEILAIIKDTTDGINADRKLLAYFSDKFSEIMRIILDINEAEEPKEKRKVPVLYIEGDGLRYKAVEKKKEEIHRIQIAEGIERNGKRTRLIGTHYFSSTNNTEEAWTLVQNYLYLRYDLSEILVISNSDGGSGYEFQKFDGSSPVVSAMNTYETPTM